MGYRSINEIFEENISQNRLSNFLSRIKDPKYKDALPRITHQGTGLAEKKAIYYINKKMWPQAKLACSLTAINELYRFNELESLAILNDYAGLISYCLSLCSDNEQILVKLAQVGKDLDIPRRNKGSLNLMLQCAMRDDVEGLKSVMLAYEKYKVKKRWHALQLEFYKAYIAKGESKIKEVLTELETPKLKKQNIFYGEFIDDYLSVLTAAYLKLCWRKGMEIHIESDTVPMEMMPIEPLDHYRVEYPYLEGWETDEYKETKPLVKDKIFEAVGPYPEEIPSLRSKFVSKETVRGVVEHFCTKHNKEEKNELSSLIWDAYSDPKNFDFKHKDYVEKNASFPVTNNQGDQVLEARPFWSELTEYDDEGFFRYCNHFIIMNELNINHEKVERYLETIKANFDKGGFFKKLFT